MDEARDGDGSEYSLIYLISRVNQGILREMRSRLAEFELSVQEYTALAVLEKRPGLSNAQLARRALVTPQSMIEILAKLEQRGLVEREITPDHRRILRARLTPGGQQLLGRADPRICEIQQTLLDNVTPRDQKVIRQTMLDAMTLLSGGLEG